MTTAKGSMSEIFSLSTAYDSFVYPTASTAEVFCSKTTFARNVIGHRPHCDQMQIRDVTVRTVVGLQKTESGVMFSCCEQQ